MEEIKFTKLNKGMFVQLNKRPASDTSSDFLRQKANQLFDKNSPSKSHDKLINSVANGRNTFYAMNIQNATLPKKLKKFALNIDPNVNKLKDESHGVNVPTFYLSGPLATTPMHCEDGYLDAVNAMLYGDKNAFKVWLFVHPAYSGHIHGVICAEWEKIRAKEQSVAVEYVMQKWAAGCSFPFHHKSLVLTSAFLREHKVPHEIVIQEPGDVLYVRPTIYHQVVNTGVTFAEAVNVGSAEWLTRYSSFTTCSCEDKCISYIVPNLDEEHNKIQIIQKSLMQACNLCPAYFNLKQDLDEHTKVHELLFKCELCDKICTTRKLLKSHRNRMHARTSKKSLTGTRICPGSNPGQLIPLLLFFSFFFFGNITALLKLLITF